MKRGLTGVLVCSALLVCAMTAAARRPMTFMDVIEMRSVSGGVISPNGKLVAYTTSIPQWKVGKNFGEIFVAATDGSTGPRQITFTREKNESGPQWARDSRTLGFLSDRDGTNQLYLMSVDGGEPRRVGDHKQAVNSFAFSRDGKWVAYSTGKAGERQIWLYGMERDEPSFQLTKQATGVGNWVWDPDSSRIFFLAPDRAAPDDTKRRELKFDVRIMDEEKPVDHIWSITIADRIVKRWTTGAQWGVGQFTVSADSTYIAFRTDPASRYGGDDESELYLLSTRTGEQRRLTQNGVHESLPRFSPDSKWLAFTAADGFTRMRNEKLYVAPVAGGELRKLLPDWDHNAGVPAWRSDSRALYFTEGFGVDGHLFSVSLPEGKLSQLTRERGDVNASYDAESGLFLINFTDPRLPADYYIARLPQVSDRSRWVRVSNANPQVENFALGEYETVHWKSSDGSAVEGILVKPVGYTPGKRYPLIVQVHGGPAAASMDVFSGNYGNYVHVFANNGYAVLQPNYRGSDNYGEKFRTQIAGDYFRLGFDDIMTGVDSMIERGIADPEKLGMMGWSAGGHWSNWALTHTDRFKAISTGAGAVNWISMYAQTDVQGPREFYFNGKPWENWDHYQNESPLKYIRNAKTPTLIQVGEADPRVPKPQSDELHMALKKLGVPTEYLVYPGMPHGLTEPRYRLVKMMAEFNWFEKWIKGSKKDWLNWKEVLATLD